MAHTSKIFTRIPIDVPNRSGFDMSFENLLTLKCGTLTPVLCEEVIPNETYNIGHVSQIQLPPMATNFYGRIDLRFEAFFVPNRILWGGWQNFWTMPENNPFGSTGVIRPTQTPSARVSNISRGSLADYLGLKGVYTGDSTVQIPNILPFLAYHRIWDEWYRNPNIQNPAFRNTGSAGAAYAYSLPWWGDTATLVQSALQFADGVSLTDLRQRNWAKDYFTTAALYPQASGDAVGSAVESNVSEEKVTISIPALRAANVLQRWMDRNNVAGGRYPDQIKAQYGILPSDAFVDRPLFLGSDVVGVYNRSVYTTSGKEDSGTTGSVNPFSISVGSKAGDATGFKDGTLVKNFRTTEHGYIMILASLVPHAYYSTGVRRQLYHSQVGDFAIPLLEGVGEQAIYNGELFQNFATSQLYDKSVFGYQQQYSEYKYHDDEVHGLLVDGESLQSFALQRSFDSFPALSSAFLEIPTTFLDQVTSVASTVSNFGAWLDCYVSMRKVSPLAEYVIPTLGDLKNTHKENIPYRGRQL